jgi:hypothetical protein
MPMRLEPLYRMEFDYPHAWGVSLAEDGPEGHHLFLAEGRCEGRLSGSMKREFPSPQGRAPT